MADETPVNVRIERTQPNDDPSDKAKTTYVMKVWRGDDVNNSWRVDRKYSEFSTLYSLAKIWLPWLDIPFPSGSSMFGKLDMVKLAERQKGLQFFLDILMESSPVMWQPETLSFLGVANTHLDFLANVKLDVAMYFRSENLIKGHEPLTRPGSRIRRVHYRVDIEQPALTWLAMSEKDDTCVVPDDGMKSVLALLPELKHPFIALVQKTEYVKENKMAFVFSHLEKRGSIKDLLWQAAPTDTYLKKYLNKKGSKPLEIMTIRLYARQILEALSFLHKKGFPYGNLHSGNVLVDNRKCRLTNLENAILGLPPYCRYKLVAWKRCTTVYEADVVMFGALLYEMCTGQELSEHGLPPAYPETMSERVKEVLVSIFSKDQPLPTINQLLQVPYFASVEMEPITGEFKRTTKVKELLDAVAENYKNSLRAAAVVSAGGTKKDAFTELKKKPSLASIGPSRSRQTINTRLSETNVNDDTDSYIASVAGASASTPSSYAPPPASSSSSSRAPSIANGVTGSSSASLSQQAVSRTNTPSPAPPAAPAPPKAPAGPPPPPAPPAPPAPKGGPPPPPPPPPSAASPAPSGARSGLLSSIENFKGGLKKVKTVDKSKPKV